MDEQKVNALINLGQGKILEKVYDDAISPPAKKVGMALSTIVDLGNTVLWPIKFLNERTRIYFENNLAKYEASLNSISEENIVDVPTEIAMPIMERFTYVSNNEISDAFVNLLTTASSFETSSKAHPGFIYLIDRLSPDEAKILKFLKDKIMLAKLDVEYYENHLGNEYKSIVSDFTLIEVDVDILNSESVNLYFDNLISLGIVKNTSWYTIDLKDEFEQLIFLNKHIIESYKKENQEDELFNKQIRYKKSMYIVTDYGRVFLDAVIK